MVSALRSVWSEPTAMRRSSSVLMRTNSTSPLVSGPETWISPEGQKKFAPTRKKIGVVLGALTPISSSSRMCFLSAPSSRPVQPAITSSLIGAVIGAHQVGDSFVEAVPRRLAEVMVADDERRAGVELLVLQVAAGELRAD